MLRSPILLAFSVVFAVGCFASNPETLPPSASAEPPGPDVPTGPAGGLGEQCEVGGACDDGLRCCGNGPLCLGIPKGQACTASGDCCPGLTCVSGECLAENGDPCVGSSDCAQSLACEDGVCGGLPEPDCGRDGQTCCPRVLNGENAPFCESGFVCNGAEGGDCVACGDGGQPCCDGESRCPEQSNAVCIIAQTGVGDALTETCQVEPDCGTLNKTCCASNGCEEGTVCNSDAVCQDDDGNDINGCCVPEGGCGDLGQACCSRGCNTPDLTCIREPDATSPNGVRTECRRLEDVQAGSEDDECGEEEGSRCCLPSFSCSGGLTCEAVTLSFNGDSDALTCRDCGGAGAFCGSGGDGCCAGHVCSGGRCASVFGCTPGSFSSCAGQQRCEEGFDPGVLGSLLKIPALGQCVKRTEGQSCNTGTGDCDESMGLKCVERRLVRGDAGDRGRLIRSTYDFGNRRSADGICEVQCGAGTADCSSGPECCSGQCNPAGKCTCIPNVTAMSMNLQASLCQRDGACCAGGRCIQIAEDGTKACVSGSVLGEPCTEAGMCGTAQCEIAIPTETTKRCCNVTGSLNRAACRRAEDCCGGQTCESGSCQPVPRSGSCVLGKPGCAEGLSCMGPPGGSRGLCG